jgi:hypothetical protein
LGLLSPTHDVGAFLEAVTVQLEELNQRDLWFHVHAHRRIHSIRFTCKADGKVLFYMIIVSLNCCVI